MGKNVLRDLRIACRKLAGSPFYTSIIVVVLGLSIGANTAIFSIIKPLVLEPLPFREPDSLVRLFTTNERTDDDDRPLAWVDFDEADRHVKSFAGVAAFRPRWLNLSGPTEATRVRAAEVTGSFFQLFDVEARRGRLFDEEERRQAQRLVVISEELAQRLSGAGEPVGQTILLDELPYEVIGVAARGFDVPSSDTNLWIPLQLADADLVPGRFILGAFGRLAPGVERERAEDELASAAKRLATTYPETHEARGFNVISLHEAVYGRQFRNAVTIFLLAVLFVHLIAVINVAILLFIRATSREHEFALRTALGASRLNLLRMFLVEALVLCVLAGIVGLLVGALGVNLLLSMLPSSIPRLENVTIDSGVLSFTLVLAALTAGICALAPIALVRRRDLVASVNEQGRSGRGGRRRRRVQRGLVASEVALACILLIASLVLIRSFEYLRRTDPGFAQQNLLTLQVSPSADPTRAPERVRQLPVLYNQLAEEIAAVPGVVAATFASELPGESAPTTRFSVVGNPPPANGREPGADLVVTGPAYFQALRIPLVSGRFLQQEDTATSTAVAVVNRAFARRHLKDKDPLTATLRIRGRDWRIVGVVGDVRQGGLEDPAYSTMYLSHDQQTEPLETVAIAVRTAADNPLLLVESVRGVVGRVMPGVPIYQVKSMEAILSDDIAGTWTMSRLLAIFAGLAWVLTATGIYGVMAYSVSQRLHEIGVRLAIGADRNSILRMLLREGAVLAFVGIVPGLIGALIVTRLLTNWVHGIDAFDLSSVIGTALLLTITGVVASLVAARRALRVNPTTLLMTS